MTLSRSLTSKTLAAALAVTTIGAAMAVSTGSAEAQWRGRGYGYGVAGGVLGGLAAGAIISGAARPYGYGYGYPAYGQRYVEDDYYEPVCHIERQQVYIDEVRFRYRNVRVCR